MLNGALINVKVRYDDGSEEIIDEIKPKSVKKCDIHTAEEKNAIGIYRDIHMLVCQMF